MATLSQLYTPPAGGKQTLQVVGLGFRVWSVCTQMPGSVEGFCCVCL